MAEVSFDTLEALDRTPVSSDTAANIVSGYKRWVTVNGPIKIEYNYYQQGDGDDFANEDTFVTSLAHPIVATVSGVGDDVGFAFPGSVTLEAVEDSATFKTVKAFDIDAVNGAGILVTVFGY